MESFTDSVQVHDKYQFELKFSYPVERSRESSEYHVETFMFIPNNLCVNKRTYSREDFFNDMQKYIRFKTPAVLLRVMDNGEESPLSRLSSSMRRLAESPGQEAAKDYEERLKMFCSVIKSALRDEESFIESSKGDPNFRVLVENYLKVSSEIIGRFRDMKLSIQVPTVDRRLLKMFELADEFISITANRYRYRLFLFLKGLEAPLSDGLKERTLECIRSEIAHRASCMYPSIPKEGSDNEDMVYREGVLKKIMASVLFLKTSTRREGACIEQVAFGIAAGLAMAFATGVAFLSRNIIQDFSMTFFVVLVVSYMFKDRIKELVRLYLHSKIRERLYDFRTDIFNALEKKVGACRESFSFIQERLVPAEIQRHRNKDYMSELENGCLGEDVILYRKSIKLFSKQCESIFSGFNVDGVVDIMRFNIREFLEKMDNPTKEIFMPSQAGDVLSVKAKRVYHINIIIKYGMEGHDDCFRHFRLVLSRNGIRRIEQVAAPAMA